MVISLYLEKTREIDGNYDIVRGSAIESSINRMSARIEAIRVFAGTPEIAGPDIEKLTEDLSKADDKLTSLNRLASGLDQKFTETAENYHSINAKMEDQKKRVDQLDIHQKAALNEIRESLKLDEARKLWGGFGKSAAISFWSSFVLIIVILISFPLLAYYQRAEIIEFLRNLEVNLSAGSNGNGAVASTFTAFGRLLIITAPLGFVVWLVRLLVRFNMRSMLLMDDARSRVTMLDTYLFLIGQDAAVKQDRGAILEALFRRAPGHGGDTAEPPHFTDLLRYGQEGKGGN